MNLTNINNSKVFQSISDTVFYLQLKPSTTHFISHVWWTLSPSPRPLKLHWNIFFKSSFLFSSLSTVITPYEQSLLLFSWARGRKGGSAHAWIASSLAGRRSPISWSSQSCCLSSYWFFGCENPFIDNPMVIAEPAVVSARSLGLGPKLYLRSMPRTPNKDLTWVVQSLSWLRQNWPSERKAAI